MDVNIPGMDGLETTAKFMENPYLADIPIIALTAHAMESDRLQALEAGCDDYATKPVDFPDLLIKIGKLTES